MKRLIYLLFCLILSIDFVLAQTIKVTGAVVSEEEDEPLTGASITVKGTVIGTTTDFEGKFSLEVPLDVKNLTVDFLGFRTQEVAVSPVIHIVLQVDNKLLNEIVVTALGISREKKSVGYALQEVGSEELTKAGQMNVINSLSGKIAGLQVSSAGGQIGSSQRIVIRGNSSLGNNEPLIVVDGIPIVNDKHKTSVDYGSGLNDINPNDIASITVLKGGSAALYGMRAGNGVILITTKSGKSGGKGVEIQYEGNLTVDQIYNLPKMQNKYGQGQGGSEYDYSVRKANGYIGSYADFAAEYGFAFGGINGGIDESWGPRLDIGLSLPQVNSPIVDGVRQPTPWVSRPNNIQDFLQLGYSMNHNVSVTNRSDNSMTRVSLGYRDQIGTIPNMDQQRYSAQVSTQMTLNKYVDFDFSSNFIHTESSNLPETGYVAGNVLQSLIQFFGRQVDMKDLKEKWDTIDSTTGLPYTWNPNFHQNPYYTVYKNTNALDRNRFFGKSSLFFKPFDFLKFEGRLGYDHYDIQTNENRVYSTDNRDGYFRQTMRKRSEVNADFMAYFDKTFGNLSVNAIAGANYRDYRLEEIRVGADMLTIPGLFTLSNVKGSPAAEMDHEKVRSNSVYSALSIGYKSQLYIDASARNDWSSTIKDPFFYPSMSASWIPTTTFKGLQSDFLTYLKLRGGVAKIGSATSAYRLGSYYSSGGSTIYGNAQFMLSSIFPPKELHPESVITAEGGVEVKLFDNRLGVDLARYTKKTTDQIMEVATSKTTGYNAMLINAGKIANNGWEIQLTGTVVKTKDWHWNLTVNWANDKSKIIDLYTDPVTGQKLEQFIIGSDGNVYLQAKPGESWGSIYGSGMVEAKDANGNPIEGTYVIGENGLPLIKSKKLGSAEPKWRSGLRSDVAWKNLSLGFLLDYRNGGDIFSATQTLASYAGILDYTAAGDIREKPIVVGKEVASEMGKFVKEDGTPNDIETDARSFFYDYFYNSQFSVFDGSYLKLREVYINYTFPKEVLHKTKYIKAANISLIGSNLAILWLHPSNKAHIDPDSSISSENSGVGLELGAYMPSRSMGIKLGLTF